MDTFMQYRAMSDIESERILTRILTGNSLASAVACPGYRLMFRKMILNPKIPKRKHFLYYTPVRRADKAEPCTETN